jgi:hypothetical protein
VTYRDLPDEMEATASSDLNVTLERLSGPCDLNGETLTYTGAGTCRVKPLRPGTTSGNPPPRRGTSR